MAKVNTSGNHRLYRSESDRIVAGVAGGLAEYFGIDPVLVRIITALAILAGGGLIVYLVMWLIVPSRSSQSQPAKTSIEDQNGSQSNRAIIGFLLIGAGVVFLLNNFHLFPWYVWHSAWKFWPVVLIFFGIRQLSKN